MTHFRIVPCGKNANRIVVLGKTRSGKTTLAIMLAAQSPRVVWFDVKGMNDPGYPIHKASEFLDLDPAARRGYLIELLDREPRITVQLANRPGVDDDQQLDAVCEAAYSRGNVLFVLDDAMGIVESDPPYYLNRIVTMGAARGVGCMAIMQRAHRVPLVLQTEANLVFVFELLGEDDVKRLIAQYGSALAGSRELGKHWFIAYDVDEKTAELCKPLTV